MIVSKPKHKDAEAGEDESTTSSPDREPQRTAAFRDFINAYRTQLHPQLFATKQGGQMIEPTLEAIHQEETIEYALALCDRYDVAETEDEISALAEELNTLGEYLKTLWARRPSELEHLQQRVARGEKVRTDGMLIIPPGWSREAKQ